MKKLLFLSAIATIATVCLSTDAFAIRLGLFEIHPFLTLTERYTDNVFNTSADERPDFSTVITPGVQVIFPRVKKKYHLDIVYQADIEIFNKYTSENATNHKALGKFEINLPSGIGINLSEEFVRNHDSRGVNIGEELAFYKYSLASASIAYKLSDRFKIQADYTNFIVKYEADRNSFMDRADNTLAGYVYYRVMPKTSAFIEYEYVLIDFDESDFDGDEHHIFGGVTWEVTEKTKGTIKGGYGIKNFKDPSLEKFRGYLMEANIDYNITTRHSLKLKATRETNETNVYGTDFFVTTGFSLEYFHRFTGKITGRSNISYGVDSYHGLYERQDDTWKFGLGFTYSIQKWLITEAGYQYTNRTSNFDYLGYKNNLFNIRVTTTL